MTAKTYLPSRNLAIILGVLVIIGGGILLIGFLKNKKQITENARLNNTEVVVLGDLVEKDTDGDGLKDWEESLFGTDSTKTDTDGDGVSDWDEAAMKRQSLSETSAGAAAASTPATPLDDVTRQLYATIASLKQGGAYNSANEQTLTTQLSTYLSTRTIATIYTKEDLKVVPDTAANFLAYNQSIATILQKYKVDDTPLTSFYNIDQETIDGSKVKLIGYEALRDKLLGVTVIAGAAETHLGLINGIQQVIEDIRKIIDYEKDSLEAMRGIYYYGRDLRDISIAVNSLQMYIANRVSDNE